VLELDSMDFLDIVLELRKRYGIDIPVDDYSRLVSLESTIEYIQPLLVASAGEARHVKGTALLLNNPICEWFTGKRHLILKKKIARPKEVDVLRIDDIDYWMQNTKLISLEKSIVSFLKDLKREMDNLNKIAPQEKAFFNKIVGIKKYEERYENSRINLKIQKPSSPRRRWS